MTVAAEDLEIYSPFKVSEVTTGPNFINTDTFLKYAVVAKKKLDRDDPGLSTEEYDQAHALLIAHLVAARNGTLERTSERLDNYSYSKSAGETSFLLQYKALINDARAYLAEANGERPTQLIEHMDSANGSLKLDKAKLPHFFDNDDVEDPDEI